MLRIMCFYQAVAVEEETHSRHQHRLILFVVCVRHHPERHACGQEFRNLPLKAVIGWLMACIGITQSSAFGVKNRIETGDKHFGWNICIEQIVDAREYLSWRRCFLGCRPQHGASSRHHQRGRYSFISHIADDDPQAAIRKRDKIVEITTHLPCGLVVRLNLPSFQDGALFGQKGALNVLGGL